MPRPKQNRRICNPPKMQGFKPYGIRGRSLVSITLFYDEYESFRLLDHEGLTQEQAAERMGISRPTLTRIYEQARRKIAKAFVEGKMINIEGGNVQFDSKWYRCSRCYKLIEGLENHTPCKNCSSYGDDELIALNGDKE